MLMHYGVFKVHLFSKRFSLLSHYAKETGDSSQMRCLKSKDLQRGASDLSCSVSVPLGDYGFFYFSPLLFFYTLKIASLEISASLFLSSDLSAHVLQANEPFGLCSSKLILPLKAIFPSSTPRLQGISSLLSGPLLCDVASQWSLTGKNLHFEISSSF